MALRANPASVASAMPSSTSAGNDQLEIGSLDGRTSIGLSSRARKLLEEATTTAVA